MNATRRRAGIGVMIAIVIIALVAACQATGVRDKTGGDTAVLRLATFEGEVNDNGQNYGPQAFVDNLRKVSGGRLKVELTTDYGGNAPTPNRASYAPSPPARWTAGGHRRGPSPTRGSTGLEVGRGPMTITSYAAEKALVSGPWRAELLARLDGTGVVGLGLAVGPLRRPFAAQGALARAGGLEGRQVPCLQFARAGRTPCARSAPPRPT